MFMGNGEGAGQCPALPIVLEAAENLFKKINPVILQSNFEYHVYLPILHGILHFILCIYKVATILLLKITIKVLSLVSV